MPMAKQKTYYEWRYQGTVGTEINGATDKLYECYIGEFEDYGLRNDAKYIDVDQDFWIIYLNRRTFDEDGNTLKEYDWYLRLVDEKFVLEDLDSFPILPPKRFFKEVEDLNEWLKTLD